MHKLRRNLRNLTYMVLWGRLSKCGSPITLLLTLWLGAGFLLSACSEPVDDEVRIRQRVADMVNATEAKELGDVMEPVDENFMGNKRIRKANLRGLVLLHFRRHKKVHVFVNDLEVTLHDGEADVTCNVVMAGRNQTLPVQARVLQVKSVWKKIEGDWFVVSASWRDPLLNM